MEDRGSWGDGCWCWESSPVVACWREVVDVVEEVVTVVVVVRKKMVYMEGGVGVDGGVNGRIFGWWWRARRGSSPVAKMCQL